MSTEWAQTRSSIESLELYYLVPVYGYVFVGPTERVPDIVFDIIKYSRSLRLDQQTTI